MAIHPGPSPRLHGDGRGPQGNGRAPFFQQQKRGLFSGRFAQRTKPPEILHGQVRLPEGSIGSIFIQQNRAFTEVTDFSSKH